MPNWLYYMCVLHSLPVSLSLSSQHIIHIYKVVGFAIPFCIIGVQPGSKGMVRDVKADESSGTDYTRTSLIRSSKLRTPLSTGHELKLLTAYRSSV